MDIKEFAKFMADNILDYMPEEFVDAEVHLTEVMKNNDLKLHGIVLKLPDTNIAPTVYLDHYYARYQDGDNIESLLKQIATRCEEAQLENSIDMKPFLDFEQVKDRLYAQVINTERNSRRLIDMPHTEVADLSVIYRVHIQMPYDGIASIPVNNDLFGKWNVTVSQLHEIALENTGRIFPAKITSMMDTIQELTGNLIEEVDVTPDDMLENAIFVLTNTTGICGATEMLNDASLSKIAEKLNDDLAVLPSSTHEVLLLSYSPNDVDYLHQMVMDVNRTEVEPEDFLSNNVYRYDRKKHILSLATGDARAKEESIPLKPFKTELNEAAQTEAVIMRRKGR